MDNVSWIFGNAQGSRKVGRGAFTLIELLVVISIIALLIGILLPVLGNAREAALTAKCLVNMRTLTQASLNYSVDNDDSLPRASTTAFNGNPGDEAVWFVALDSYLGQLTNTQVTVAGDRRFDEFKQDPVYTQIPTIPTVNSQNLREFNRTIKMNEFINEFDRAGQVPTGDGYTKIYDIPSPSETAFFADGHGTDTTGSMGTTNITEIGRFNVTADRVALRHADNSANVSKADGSASNEKMEILGLWTPDDSNRQVERWFPDYTVFGPIATRNPEQRLIWNFRR
ncbi:MAG: prepilin-type N-terminal cleavage/methylation domain-containing protein [Planctomycetota bacterium]